VALIDGLLRCAGWRTALLGVGLLLSGCSSVNPYYDPSKPHHRRDGFQNIDPAAWMPRAFGEFVRWQRERSDLQIPAPSADLSVVPAELDFIRANRSAFAVTWIGHATALVQVAGVNILTDPVFSNRASPLQWAGPGRWQPPGVALRDLPHIDIVLISHNHYDHLDESSVKALAAQPGGPPLFVVPLGIERWLAAVGIATARALDWWDRTESHGLTIHLTPAQHWSRRSFTDTMQTLWGGFVVETADKTSAGKGAAARRRVFYAGDTGWSTQHFDEIGRRFAPIDLALIPIGAYEPRWFMAMQHVNPEEAVRIHQAIGARASLGVHWGTFLMTDEPLDQPLRDLAAARASLGVSAEAFRTLRHGQTWRIDAP
jgi:L-ascorbate metabolism protein UlaG (beta-lactamase superfamily)